MKYFLRKHLIIYFFIIFISSCSSSDTNDAFFVDSPNNSLAYSNVSNTLLRINNDVFNSINNNRMNNLSLGSLYIINKVNRVGDLIEVNLSYSGGCKQHEFEIIWDGIVYTDDPCHMNLLLIHNSNNDNCEALITETISINLKELVGDNVYKDSCAYHIFSTYNSSEIADTIIEGSN